MKRLGFELLIELLGWFALCFAITLLDLLVDNVDLGVVSYYNVITFNVLRVLYYGVSFVLENQAVALLAQY